MKAFHGDQVIKQKYLDRLAEHRKLDQLVRGTGWDGHKGCAVGCTLEQYSHDAYETELGIPKELAGLEDAIFEGLPQAEAMEWPQQFLDAIKPGADLVLVWNHFAVWLLSDPEHGTSNFCDADGKAATAMVVDLHKQVIAGVPPTDAARAAAWDAARDAAWDAARDAARAAAWDAARDAAWDAAREAAWEAAWDAARDAATDAARAAAWVAAWVAATAAAYIRQRDKLLELLRSVND